MSYCRWSSDDWRSDVYAYADVSGGYRIHVAATRYKIDYDKLPPQVEVPDPLPPKDDPFWQTYLDRYRALQQAVDEAERVDINGPYDGRTYSVTFPEEALAKLMDLRAAGYYVPEYALEELRKEVRDGPTE